MTPRSGAAGVEARGFSLSENARARLLALARAALEARLAGHDRPLSPELPQELLRPSGAFVTLRRKQDGELRGCIGYVEPLLPLHETVARAAVAAATNDGRFQPVVREELHGLALEVSVLGPTFEVDPDRVEIGRHGLIVERGAARGLLLPQVPLEWAWDRERFLAGTCRKAGLPEEAWRQADVRLLAFEAFVFAEG